MTDPPVSRPGTVTAPRIQLYDTTLRDGTQGLGFNLSLDDKVRVLIKLDAMGFDYVEGGYPLSNPKDAAFFEHAQTVRLGRTRLVAFGMTRRKGQRADDDIGMAALLAAGTPAIAIVGKSWDFHAREVLQVSLDENIAMIADTVRYCHQRGKEVIYDAEHFFDGYKANPVYAVETILAALDAGADTVCLCDTNGGSLPREIGEIFAAAAKGTAGARLGIHPHNDGGVAVANALEAVHQGAIQVQGTINGVGERCGNVDLIAVAANLGLKLGVQVLDSPRSLEQLTELSQFVDDVAHRERVTGQPYVGKAAFAHKGGMHVHAVQKNAATYEHVPPESVGNRRAVLVSELSGLSNIRNRVSTILSLEQVGRDQLKQILETVARMEREGYVYENADASFELLALRLLGRAAPHFTLDNYQCGVFRGQNSFPLTTGVVTVRVGDMVRRGTAEGEDPLEALEHALREALCAAFSVLEHVRVVDRRFRAVERPGARLTRVRVSTDFTDGSHYWTTMAVGQNVIDACIESLVEGLEYFLVSSGRVVVSEESSAGPTRVV